MARRIQSELTLISAGPGRRLLSYLGGHGHAGAHPCEEVGDLSAHGTAPLEPLAPALPAQ